MQKIFNIKTESMSCALRFINSQAKMIYFIPNELFSSESHHCLF